MNLVRANLLFASFAMCVWPRGVSVRKQKRWSTRTRTRKHIHKNTSYPMCPITDALRYELVHAHHPEFTQSQMVFFFRYDSYPWSQKCTWLIYYDGLNLTFFYIKNRYITTYVFCWYANYLLYKHIKKRERWIYVKYKKWVFENRRKVRVLGWS